MAAYFNVNGTGFKGGRVAAVRAEGEARPRVNQSALTAWVAPDGAMWAPDRAEVRALLPRRWRQAFDRAELVWFRERNPSQGFAYLRTTRGRPLATIYAHGNLEA